MKKIISFLGLLLFCILGISRIASADLIPPNSHYLDRCVTISNLDQFPDITLIGFITPIMGGDKYQAYIVENNKCLTKGYKFNGFSIYWIQKIQFSAIDLNDLKLNNQKVVSSSARDNSGNPISYDVYTPADLTLVTQKIDPGSGYVSDSNPATKENIEYSIAGVDGTNLTLYMSKKTTQYNNGNPQKIETFNSSGIITNPIATPKPVVQKPKPTQTSVPADINNSTNKIPVVTVQPVITPLVTSQRGFWQSIGCFFTSLFGGSCK
jgi:hypothetical protein